MPDTNELRRYLNHSSEWQYYKTTDHDYYRRKLPDGKWQVMKVSLGCKEIGYTLWRKILKKDLRVTQSEFNAGL